MTIQTTLAVAPCRARSLPDQDASPPGVCTLERPGRLVKVTTSTVPDSEAPSASLGALMMTGFARDRGHSLPPQPPQMRAISCSGNRPRIVAVGGSAPAGRATTARKRFGGGGGAEGRMEWNGTGWKEWQGRNGIK